MAAGMGIGGGLMKPGTTITQTYTTTSASHDARTAAALSDSTGGTGGGGLGPISGTSQDANINDNFASCLEQINKLIVDQANTAQLLNQIIDDLQAWKKPA